MEAAAATLATHNNSSSSSNKDDDDIVAADVAPVLYAAMPTHTRLDDAAWAMHTTTRRADADAETIERTCQSPSSSSSCCCRAALTVPCIHLRLTLPNDIDNHNDTAVACTRGRVGCAATTTRTSGQDDAQDAHATRQQPTPLVAYEHVKPRGRTSRTAARAASPPHRCSRNDNNNSIAQEQSAQQQRRRQQQRQQQEEQQRQERNTSRATSGVAATTATTATTRASATLLYACHVCAPPPRAPSPSLPLSSLHDEAHACRSHARVDAATLPLLHTRTSFATSRCTAAPHGRRYEVRLHVYDLWRGALTRYADILQLDDHTNNNDRPQCDEMRMTADGNRRCCCCCDCGAGAGGNDNHTNRCDGAASSGTAATTTMHRLCGVYHSSIAVYGCEAYFEGGVGVAAAGRTRFGARYTTHRLGYTRRTLHEWRAWLRARERDTYTLADYDIVQRNCHRFSSAAAHFLLCTSPDTHASSRRCRGVDNGCVLPRYVNDNVAQLQRNQLAATALHVLRHVTNAYVLVAARQLLAHARERRTSMQRLARAAVACGVTARVHNSNSDDDGGDDDGASVSDTTTTTITTATTTAVVVCGAKTMAATASLLSLPYTTVVVFGVSRDVDVARAVQAVVTYAEQLLVARDDGDGVLSRDALPTLRALADDLQCGYDTLDARGVCVYVEAVAELLQRMTTQRSGCCGCCCSGGPCACVLAVRRRRRSRRLVALLDGLRVAMLHTMVVVQCAFHVPLLEQLSRLSCRYACVSRDVRVALLRVLCNMATHRVGALVLRDAQHVATWVSLVAHGLMEGALDDAEGDGRDCSDDDDDSDGAMAQCASSCVYAAACLANNVAISLVVSCARTTLAEELRRQPGTHGVHALITVLLYTLRVRAGDAVMHESALCWLLLALLRLVTSTPAAHTFAVQHPYKLRVQDVAQKVCSDEARALLCIYTALDDCASAS